MELAVYHPQISSANGEERKLSFIQPECLNVEALADPELLMSPSKWQSEKLSLISKIYRLK
jgi:hypothetical protein